jgi:hypothetical protein
MLTWEVILIAAVVFAVALAFQLSRVPRFSGQIDHHPFRFLARFLSRCVRWFIIPALPLLLFVAPVNPFGGALAIAATCFGLWVGARYLEQWITGE